MYKKPSAELKELLKAGGCRVMAKLPVLPHFEGTPREQYRKLTALQKRKTTLNWGLVLQVIIILLLAAVLAKAQAPTAKATAAAPTYIEKSVVPLSVDLSGNLRTSGGGGAGSGLTDTQLRATPVPMSLASVPLASGAATETTLGNIYARLPALITGRIPVDGSGVTQPVSGTVAVSGVVGVTGTFWQVTQPVSIATMPSTPVTGTFWQTTQPISGTITANAGTGTMAVSGPLTDTQLRLTAVPVSGTFFQATQPVSGAFFQATQPVSGSVGVTGSVAVTGPLTDTQIRATALPVSGTVTANAGTNLNTSALSTEATIAKLPLAQASTTSGQSGALVQGAVTTAAPAYTTAQTSPLSLTTGGALRVDGSGSTQPVSGTVGVSGSVAVTGPLTDAQIRATALPISGTVTANAGTGTMAVSGPLTDTQLRLTAVPISGAVTANAGTNLNTSALALDASIATLNTSVNTLLKPANTLAAVTTVGTVSAVTAITNALPTGANVIGALTANQSVNLNQVAGTATVTGGLAGSQGVGGLAASGAAKSGNPNQIGGVFNTTQPTVTTGQAVEAQATARGGLIVAPGVDGFTVTANAGTNLNTSALALDSTVAKDASLTTLNTSVNTLLKPASTLAAVTTVTTVSAVTAITNALPTGANVIGALTANQSVNAAQIGGVAPLMGNGISGTGAQRVTLASDSTGVVGLATGANVIGSLAANQSENMAQIAGTAAVNGGLAGTLAVGGTAATNAAITQKPLLIGVEALSSQPTAATTGNQRQLVGALDGALYVRPGGPIAWSCSLDALGATLTQCQAAPGASLKLYITDMVATSTTTTAGLMLLRSGTGTNCGTGTASVFPSAATVARFPYPANTVIPLVVTFATPIAVAANSQLCVIATATNLVTIQINGYTAP